MIYFFECIKKYADFNGRARRAELWQFALVCIILSFVAMIFDKKFLPNSFNLFSFLVEFGLLLPAISVGVRRLHDIGKGGINYIIFYVVYEIFSFYAYVTKNEEWNFFNDELINFLFLTLIIGISIYYICLFCKDSIPGINQYGHNPKGVNQKSVAPPLNAVSPIVHDKFDEIKKYKELLDAGIITQEEFEQKKRELL